ncbi:Hypothetical protein SRAE_1000114100 [Strongyloides ratti]|uniref:Uncharacterized protein n=1 Tax=Strongyloides ratti TaxID=34506 RepID=A0A090L5V0_STRRB|nr:Hypothetical protein SRAE_1000114100 [Strongyloides ratti]CEF62874.1 Hypothetical protein SRAE_1000114100 [Strongyloides ratti]
MLSASESAFIFFISLCIVISLILLLAGIHCFLQCRSYRNDNENSDSNLFDIIDLDKLIGRYEFIEKERLKRQSDNGNIYKQEIMPFECLKDKMFDGELYNNIMIMKKLSTSTEESTLPIYSSIDEENEKINKGTSKEISEDDIKTTNNVLEYQRTWKGLDDDLKMIPFPMFIDVECQTTETLDKVTAKEVLKQLLGFDKTTKSLETLV